jgi:hypothetical protein
VEITGAMLEEKHQQKRKINGYNNIQVLNMSRLVWGRELLTTVQLRPHNSNPSPPPYFSAEQSSHI